MSGVGLLAVALALAAAALLGGAVGAPPGGAGEPARVGAEDAAFAAKLEAVDAAVGKVTDLKASFEQRRHTALLKKPMVSRGEVSVVGEAIRWDTREPRASTMVISGEEIRVFYPDDKLIEVYSVGGDMRDIAGAPLPRLKEIRARFTMAAGDVGAMGGVDDPLVVAVVLTPKSAALAKHVRSVRVLLDGRIPAATKMEIVDGDGERTEIEFSKVRVNLGLTAADVKLEAPEGVRISRPLGDGKAGDGKAGGGEVSGR